MRALKWVSGIAVLGIGLWSGWWLIASGAQEAAVERWLADRRAEGWQAETSEVSVRGYPLDFARRVAELRLADPQAGWAWSAPLLVSESRAFAPNRFTVTLPPEQRLATPQGRALIRIEENELALGVLPAFSMPLDAASLDLRGIALDGARGWRAGAARVAAEASRMPDADAPENGYALRLDVAGLALPAELVRGFGGRGAPVPLIEEAGLDARVTLDRPLDRFTVEEGRIGARTLLVRRAGFSWGDVGLELRGRLRADAEGYPRGDLEVTARNWRRLVELAVGNGVLSSSAADGIRAALSFVSLLGGRNGDVELTLSFGKRGRVAIGPVPIGRVGRMLVPADAAG